jgi:hypothetical protein
VLVLVLVVLLGSGEGKEGHVIGTLDETRIKSGGIRTRILVTNDLVCSMVKRVRRFGGHNHHLFLLLLPLPMVDAGMKASRSQLIARSIIMDDNRPEYNTTSLETSIAGFLFAHLYVEPGSFFRQILIRNTPG